MARKPAKKTAPKTARKTAKKPAAVAVAKTRKQQIAKKTKAAGGGFVAAKNKVSRARDVMKKGKAGPVMVAKRADLNAPGEVAIERLPGEKREAARHIHAMILRLVPGAIAKVKWGNACYFENERAFAVLYETKGGVNLGLPGATLADPDRLLHGAGKIMRHVKLANRADAEHPGIPALILAARTIGFDGM